MKKMFKTPHNIMLYSEHTEAQEFGMAKKNFLLCPKCQSVYFSKSWHHLHSLATQKIRPRQNFKIHLCPACQMIQKRQYEGIIQIENVPSTIARQLSALIKSYTDKAFIKDCQHRLISINLTSGNKWQIRTTENQLANKLAQKIKETFDKVRVKIKFSKQPNDLERVYVNF